MVIYRDELFLILPFWQTGIPLISNVDASS
jgi:hypothetical protein